MRNVLGLSGSARAGSFNTKLLRYVLKVVRSKGAEAQEFDFAESPLPLYNADDEARDGFPEAVLHLKRSVREADAIIVSAPEYNAGPTPLLKNAIDWVSRRSKDGEHKNEWEDKVVGFMSASPGAFGGSRAQASYRSSLSFVDAFVLPDFIALPAAHSAFDDDGNVTNERTVAAVDRMSERLLEVSSRLRGI